MLINAIAFPKRNILALAIRAGNGEHGRGENRSIGSHPPHRDPLHHHRIQEGGGIPQAPQLTYLAGRQVLRHFPQDSPHAEGPAACLRQRAHERDLVRLGDAADAGNCIPLQYPPHCAGHALPEAEGGGGGEGGVRDFNR